MIAQAAQLFPISCGRWMISIVEDVGQTTIWLVSRLYIEMSSV